MNRMTLMTKPNAKNIVFMILALLVMIMIFMFSAQDADRSSAVSDGIVERIAPVIISDYDSLDPEIRAEKVELLSFILRKCAHFTEFAALGFCLYNALPAGRSKKMISLTLPALIGVLYAVSDEFHQHFSKGRVPSVRDVLIDSSGVVFGIILAIFLLYLVKKSRMKYISNKTPSAS